ncbi:MAG: Uma2 family endonuclease [Armatimonadota bacterium]|nr:Uma2 family endonuclease [Armatimonadota bacterium]
MVTSEEYLALEEDAEFKSEYISGEIFAMAGVTPRHVTINVNIAGALGNQLKDRPGQVYSSALRMTVKVAFDSQVSVP